MCAGRYTDVPLEVLLADVHCGKLNVSLRGNLLQKGRRVDGTRRPERRGPGPLGGILQNITGFAVFIDLWYFISMMTMIES